MGKSRGDMSLLWVGIDREVVPPRSGCGMSIGSLLGWFSEGGQSVLVHLVVWTSCMVGRWAEGGDGCRGKGGSIYLLCVVMRSLYRGYSCSAYDITWRGAT